MSSGERVQPAGMYFDGNPDPQLGKFERFEAQPNDPEALHFLMREEKHSYDRLKPGDFKRILPRCMTAGLKPKHSAL